MSPRANQNKAAATKRTAGSTQGARDDAADNNQAPATPQQAEAPRRRVSDNPKADQPMDRRAGDRRAASSESMPQAAEDAAKAQATPQRKRASGTIGSLVYGLLEKNKSTDEILKAVAKKFPDAHTSKASISWYRSQFAKQGKG